MLPFPSWAHLFDFLQKGNWYEGRGNGFWIVPGTPDKDQGDGTEGAMKLIITSKVQASLRRKRLWVCTEGDRRRETRGPVERRGWVQGNEREEANIIQRGKCLSLRFSHHTQILIRDSIYTQYN